MVVHWYDRSIGREDNKLGVAERHGSHVSQARSRGVSAIWLTRGNTAQKISGMEADGICLDFIWQDRVHIGRHSVILRSRG